MTISIIKTYPNKIAYEWIKMYDLLTIDTSNILVNKQTPGATFDICQKGPKCRLIFNAIRIIHKFQTGNDHPE